MPDEPPRAPYRDPLAGLRAQLQLHQAQIKALEQTFTRRLWHHLGAPLAGRLKELEVAAARPQTDTYESMSRRVVALQAYLAALIEARALAPRLEQELNAVPEQAPDLDITIPLFSRPLLGWGPALAPFEKALSELDPKWTRHDPKGSRSQPLYAQLHYQGAPFSFSCVPSETGGPEPTCRLQLGTSVPRGFPELRLRPEGLHHNLLKAVGLLREKEVGLLGFDGQFLIEGGARAVELLLSEEIRSGLIAVARYDIPQLEVGRGRAVLSWSYAPDRDLLRSALAVLLSIRRRPAGVKLLREDDGALTPEAPLS